MGRNAPPIVPAKGLVIELVTASTTWYPPKGVKSVLFEMTGGGQGGTYNSGSGNPPGGQSGETVFRVVHDVSETTGFVIAIGAAGAGGNSTTISGGQGGATTVTAKGTTYTALGGGAVGNSNGVSGSGAQDNTTPPQPSAYSFLLKDRLRFEPVNGNAGHGGSSPMAPGGRSGRPASLGSGGHINSVGGTGYVLVGYYLP